MSLETELGTVIAIVVCIVAAIADVRTGLIPNWLTLPVIVGAPLVHGWLLGPGALLRSLLALLLCGAMPYAMFARGGMGGGDVKLLAAVGALAGLRHGMQVELVGVTLACVWGLGVLAYRGRMWATLGRTAQVTLGRLWPFGRAMLAVDDAHVTELRLGLPIAIAAVLCTLADRIAAGGWSP